MRARNKDLPTARKNLVEIISKKKKDFDDLKQVRSNKTNPTPG
jgi:hypothetical protein